MAEAIGVAGSVIAVVELSAKVASLCLQYSKDVKHAKGDILRLRRQVNDLGNVVDSVQQLLDGPGGQRLRSSQNLLVAVQDGRSQLQGLLETLRPTAGRSDESAEP